MLQLSARSVSSSRHVIKRGIVGLTLLGLGITLYLLFAPFLLGIAWAGVAVLGAWPLHLRICRYSSLHYALPAAISTVVVTALLCTVLVPVTMGLREEVGRVSQELPQYFDTSAAELSRYVASIPVVGNSLASRLKRLEKTPESQDGLISLVTTSVMSTASAAALSLVGVLFDFSVFLCAMFFLFLYGDTLALQVRSALLRLSPDADKLLTLVHGAILGTLYGTIFAAIAQGLLAGIGFAVAGARNPTLLGVLTMICSFLPFGPPVLYVPVSVVLVMQGAPWQHGLLLALWGVFVISIVDNVVRTVCISRTIQLPVPLVLVGVFGGLLTFGLIGIFVGPIAMALMQIFWHEWIFNDKSTDPVDTLMQQHQEAPRVAEKREQGASPGLDGELIAY